MKKSSKFLLGTIFSLLGFVAIFGASSYAETNCLKNYTTEELQKIQTVKTIVKNNADKFEEKFIWGKQSAITFAITIDNSLACRGGFVNFKDFNDALKSFILSLVSRQITLEKMDSKFENAEESLKQNLVDLIPWKFEDATKSEQNTEIDLEIKFKETDKTNKGNDNDINAKFSMKTDGKFNRKDMEVDTDFSVKFGLKGEAQNSFSKEREKIAIQGKLDSKILMEKQQLWLQLKELELDLGDTNNMQGMMFAGMLTEFKKKIGKKFIHIPLNKIGDMDEIKNFSSNGKNPFSLEKFKDIKIFNFVKYQDKNTIQINKDICNIIPLNHIQNTNTTTKNNCEKNITKINHQLLYISKIEKISDNERKITGKNVNNSFMILRNKERIKEIKITSKILKLDYKNDDFSFIAKDETTEKDVFTLKGKIIPKDKINLNLELTENDKLHTFEGNILFDKQWEQNHALITISFLSNEGFKTINGMFKLEINELVKKISSFKINTPEKEDTIEIEELQSQFGK